MTGPIHLKPAAELAPRVLLPGDPHRALAVAQDLLDEPRMFNHHRGLWGYTGVAPDGELLTVQATGMGGPSAAIVVEELLDLGAELLVRIGTCAALTPALKLGDLLAVSEAISADGASCALGADGSVAPDPGLAAALERVAGRAGKVVSADLFYDPRAHVPGEWADAGALAVEMEAATVLQAAGRRGARAGCLLAVSDQLAGGRRRIDREALEQAGLELGRSAWAAIG